MRQVGGGSRGGSYFKVAGDRAVWCVADTPKAGRRPDGRALAGGVGTGGDISGFGSAMETTAKRMDAYGAGTIKVGNSNGQAAEYERKGRMKPKQPKGATDLIAGQVAVRLSERRPSYFNAKVGTSKGTETDRRERCTKTKRKNAP